jgi:pimeloyl-ACP methyl ester carboxylesterase
MDRPAALARVRTPDLEVAYLDEGPRNGPVVVLLHGFPYDVRAYDDVVPLLVGAGRRVIVPYLRGYGPTRFLSAATPRSGQQAALGADLLALLDALGVPTATVAGYDWGGRAGCVVAALWPERVDGLVTAGGYNVLDVAGSVRPLPAVVEHRLWYQWYFCTERGRSGLQHNRADVLRLLWQQWSPTWAFDDATFARSAPAFANDDFVDVVIHSYRHRYDYVAGDPRYDELEQRLAARPSIDVPAIAIGGTDNGVLDVRPVPRELFPQLVDERAIAGAGHNLPQEAPAAFAAAILDLPRR